MPRPSLDLSSPEIHIVPKLIESSEMGVSASELGYAVDAFVDGAYAGDYFDGGDKIDLTIVGDESFAGRTQDLLSLPVATRSGQVVPLSSLADVQYSSGPEAIHRRERLRAITIQVTPPVTMPLEEAMQLIDQKIVSALQDEGKLDGEIQSVWERDPSWKLNIDHETARLLAKSIGSNRSDPDRCVCAVGNPWNPSLPFANKQGRYV